MPDAKKGKGKEAEKKASNDKKATSSKGGKGGAQNTNADAESSKVQSAMNVTQNDSQCRLVQIQADHGQFHQRTTHPVREA